MKSRILALSKTSPERQKWEQRKESCTKAIYIARRPPIQANNFELKSVTLHMLQNILFHKLPHKNPNMHVTNFLEVWDTIKYNGVTEEAFRLRLFPLSQGDRAKHWLTSQPPDSITSWNNLVSKFLTKFFPPSKIAQLVQEINTFGKLEGENLVEAWLDFTN